MARLLPNPASKPAQHAMGRDGMDQWVRFLARMTKPGGTALVVHLAEALPKLLCRCSRGASAGSTFFRSTRVPASPRSALS